MKSRRAVGYPPVLRLVEIDLKHSEQEIVERESHDVASLFLSYADSYGIQVRGPACPPIHKIKNTHTRKIYLKGGSMKAIQHLYTRLNRNKLHSSICFTPNPGAF